MGMVKTTRRDVPKDLETLSRVLQLEWNLDDAQVGEVLLAFFGEAVGG